MKHKTEYRQNTLESSSQTSSGVTVWLSMAGRSSPFSELQTASGRLCRDPGGGQGRVIHRTEHMEIILQQNHQNMVKLCPGVHNHLAQGLFILLYFWFI